MLDFFLKKLEFTTLLCNTNIVLKNVSFVLQTSFISNCFVVLILFLYLITTIYSIGYLNLEKDRHKIRFHIFTFCSVLSCIGLAYSGNLFTAFIFYDILSVFTYALVRHNGDRNSEKHAFLYAMYLILPSMFFLFPAIICVYYVGEHTNFITGGILSGLPLSKQFVNMVFLLFIYGISKTALYPLHKWLIHAMVAPSPVSALLHAVLVVKGGLFFLYKVINETFGIEFLQENIYQIYGLYWPVYIACFGIIFAGISAINSENIKQRLAYSTISQIGYISMCMFLFTEISMSAAKMHFLAHSFSKIALFYYAGYLLAKYHCININELKMIRNRFNVVLSIFFLIPCISLMSFPLTIGFLSKHAMLSMLTDMKYLPILITIFIGMLLCILYLFPIIQHLTNFDNSKKNITQKWSVFCVYFSSGIVAIIIILFFSILENFKL